MAGMLKGGGSNLSSGPLGAKQLFVRGLPYANTAAKFWTCLMDEVVADYPPDTGVTLSAPTGGMLGPELLVPEALLQKDLERLSETDAQEAFEDALKALEILGPPSSVCLRLISAKGDRLSQDIPLDYLDAEILPFLLAWLLEWANVPDVLWNKDQVRGDFVADDQDRRLRYFVVFELRSRHLSEGLFDREAIVNFRRERHPQPMPLHPIK